RSGAGPGATAAFLMSTPQTGVDSMLVTYGLLGPVFAVVRPLVAFISGTFCGWAVDAWGRAPTLHEGESTPSSEQSPVPVMPAWRRALRHGFVVLPRDIYRALLLGLVVAGVLGALMPADYFASRFPEGLVGTLSAMGLMMLIGIPLYVCSTASVPIGLSLLAAGVPPGAVLVFLITGPATNAATIATLSRLLGTRSAVIYLACLSVSALVAGLLVEAIHPEITLSIANHCAHETTPSLFQHTSAVALLLVMLWPLVASVLRRRKTA
ncbi:MAG: permease, partial [Kiritimatiellae bacterium]|nr:permease [Kiritimatiellia bacterium]